MRRRARASAPVALITGAGRGIGLATAEAFAAAGYAVVLAELRPEPGRRAARALARAGGRAWFRRTDVADARSVDGTVRATFRRFGRLDVVVNNAGALRVGALARLPVRDLDRMLTVNLRGPLLVTRAALPAMLRRGSGAIVNVASMLGKSGLRQYVTYCATKFGVVGLTEALADELHGTGVRVWAVCPGLTDTPMARLTLATPRERARLIRPATIARAILDLATGRRRAPSGAAIEVTR
ncbi:MAG: SDR family oxidoreductase [Candidatus Rokubacteria bacterium]|nr:SDR family oxidoreductase [Candidatus Rokubacteria bacterium]